MTKVTELDPGMRAFRVRINPKEIIVKAGVPHPDDPAVFDYEELTCPNRPKDEFSQALNALESVFCEVMKVGAEWAKNIVILELVIKYRESGALAALIKASREFPEIETAKEYQTPAFVYSPADDEERQCKPASAAKIEEAAEQALRYYAGDRQPMMLSGEDPCTKGDGNDDPTLPGT